MLTRKQYRTTQKKGNQTMQEQINYQQKQYRRGLITEIEYYQELFNIAIEHNKNRIAGYNLKTIYNKINKLEKEGQTMYYYFNGKMRPVPKNYYKEWNKTRLTTKRKLNYKGIASVTAIVLTPFIIHYTTNRIETAIRLQAAEYYIARWQALLIIEILALATSIYYVYNKLK